MDMSDDTLTEIIISCIIRVHQILGPGFLESVYRRALIIELKKKNLSIESEKEVIIYYEGQEVGCHRLDILVENSVIIELKCVDAISKAHYAQVRSYLKATRLPIALIVNFSREMADYRRIT